MDPQEWNRVDDLLGAALKRAPEEREAFLRQACEGEEQLEREVRSLLSFEQGAANFLETPAIEIAARAIALRQQRNLSQGDGSLIGHTISHYRIFEKLG